MRTEKEFPWCGICTYLTQGGRRDNYCVRAAQQRDPGQEACALFRCFREDCESDYDMASFYARYPEAIAWRKHDHVRDVYDCIHRISTILLHGMDFEGKGAIFASLIRACDRAQQSLSLYPERPTKENVR